MVWFIFKQFLFQLSLFTSTALFSCPVCGFGQDGSQFAFLLTTALLTFSPLVLGAGVIFYLYRAKQKQ